MTLLIDSSLDQIEIKVLRKKGNVQVFIILSFVVSNAPNEFTHKTVSHNEIKEPAEKLWFRSI